MKIRATAFLLSLFFISSIYSQSRRVNTAEDFMIYQKEKIGKFLASIKKGKIRYAYSSDQSDIDKYFKEIHSNNYTSIARVNKEFRAVLNNTYLIEDLVNLVKALDSLEAVNPIPDSQPVLTDEFYQRIQNFDEKIQANVNKTDLSNCNQKYLLGLAINRFAFDICASIHYEFDLNEPSDVRRNWLNQRDEYWRAQLYDWGLQDKNEVGIFLNIKGMYSQVNKPGGGIGLSFGGFSKNKTNPFTVCEYNESFYSPSNWTLIEVDYNYLAADRGGNHIIGMSLLNMRWTWFGFPLHVNVLQLQHANGTGGNTWFYTPEVGLNWRNFLLTASFPLAFKEGYNESNINAIPPVLLRGTWRIPVKSK